MSFRRTLTLAATAVACVPAFAQTTFNEVEPNGPKAEATAVACLTSGDSLAGTTTGSGTLAGDTASTTADTFRVKTCALPPGIYRHEVVLTTTGTAGHIGSLRGLTQTAGSPNAGTDTAFQTATSTSTPPRKNVWYGFGNEEEVYYRVTGTASTTDPYLSTLTTTAPGFTVIGPYVAGTITITTCGQGHTNDTDLWVYDSTLAAIPGYGIDDASPACSGHALGSTLTRNFAVGTYYLAMTTFNFANNLGSIGPGEGFQTGVVMDFPDVAGNSVTTGPTNVAFGVTDSAGTVMVAATKPTAFDIVWFRFDVAPPAPPSVGIAYCFGDGMAAACPCGNSGAAGRGCENSATTGGSRQAATGTASLAADTVVLTASDELPTALSIMLQGDTSVPHTFFGDGLRCAGGILKRLYVKNAVLGEVSAPALGDDPVSVRSSALGDPLAPGMVRFYQTYYRDANPGFCVNPPGNTWNISNGLMIFWGA